MATYVRRNGEKLGPFEDAQLLSSLQQGMFSYDDLALRDGWTDWRPLRTLFAPPGIAPPVTRPAPKTASTSAEQLMWSGRPSHWNFLFSWLLAFLFVGAGALCVWIYFSGGTSPLLLVPGARWPVWTLLPSARSSSCRIQTSCINSIFLSATG